MGWYKEYLQDLADIQAEEDRRKTWSFIGAIPGCVGAFGLWKTISDFSQGEFLGSLEGLGLFIVMLLPMFICGAKAMGGLGGGIGGIILSLMVTGFLYYTLPNKEELDAKKAEAEKIEANFETLRSLIKSFEGRKAKDCIGYWKGDDLLPLHISKKGKNYTWKLLDEDGKQEEFSAITERKEICYEDKDNNTCRNLIIKEAICDDYYCIVAKGDSAYYFETTAPFSFWGYARTNKNDFDKEVKKRRKSSSK